jgi:hypothetical protein
VSLDYGFGDPTDQALLANPWRLFDVRGARGRQQRRSIEESSVSQACLRRRRPLLFVDPNETDPTYRVCLWAAPGQGKSVAAASPHRDPILVLSADRPSAYRFARKHHKGKRIDEVRYQGDATP